MNISDYSIGRVKNQNKPITIIYFLFILLLFLLFLLIFLPLFLHIFLLLFLFLLLLFLLFTSPSFSPPPFPSYSSFSSFSSFSLFFFSFSFPSSLLAKNKSCVATPLSLSLSHWSGGWWADALHSSGSSLDLFFGGMKG